MKIEAQLNSAHIKQPCAVCGNWGRPGDVAFFTDGGEWLCDPCFGGGEAHIRWGLRENAAYLRREADKLEATADGEITLPDESEVSALVKEVERYYEQP